LSQLGRPAMSQSLFDLGSAIGGVPGQMKQQRKQQEFNQLMQQIQGAQGSGDFTSMKILAQQLATTNPQEAAKVMQAATALEEKQKTIEAGSGMFSKAPEQAREAAAQLVKLGRFSEAEQALTRAESLEQREKEVDRKRTSAQMLMSEIQQVMKTPNISKADKEKALGLLREAAQAGEDSDLLKPRVEELKKSLLPQKAGSRAAPVFKDLMRPNPQTGQLEKRTIRFDTDLVTGGLIETDVGLTPPKEFAPKDTSGAKKGDVAQSARSPWEDMNEVAATSAISLIRNKNLATQIASEPDKATGLVSQVRTKVLDIAGLRDAEENLKTEFLRGVNTEIIGSLPPGVASDRDIEIFSSGFPDDSRSTQQILEYLEVERRFLGALQDKALLAEQFLDKQMTSGQDGNFVGFNAYQRNYSSSLKILDRYIADASERGQTPEQAQEEALSFFKNDFGFVPAYYL